MAPHTPAAPIVDDRLAAWMREIRRTLHRNPELSGQEHRTCRYIASKLEELGIPFQAQVAGTGILARLGPVGGGGVALRADIDALPIEEQTGLPFASEHPGVMHACGHDGHVAMLLGAAALLARSDLPGPVTFIFQPAEEGEGGAQAMIGAGALAGARAIYAGHIDRHFRVGEIAVNSGLITAYTDEFLIEVRGRGGHAAKPHETVDSLLVASLLVMSIQTLVSRETDPVNPTVITVGRIQGGTAPNVIAESAHLEGTIRTTHPEARRKVIAGLERMVKAMEELYGARTSVRIAEGYPPVVNHPAAARIARDAAAAVVGPDGVVRQPYPSLGGEDFSYYLAQTPGCMVRFGAAPEEGKSFPAHSPRFDFDEGVLPLGAAFLAQTAIASLRRLDELPPSPAGADSGPPERAT
ncbi:MAG: M20 family metallopeptidase [Desulfobacteraceae bacterium]|nr:M20 family metallopeptidase [Desulfobacteraceae bacterium]